MKMKFYESYFQFIIDDIENYILREWFENEINSYEVMMIYSKIWRIIFDIIMIITRKLSSNKLQKIIDITIYFDYNWVKSIVILENNHRFNEKFP